MKIEFSEKYAKDVTEAFEEWKLSALGQIEAALKDDRSNLKDITSATENVSNMSLDTWVQKLTLSKVNQLLNTKRERMIDEQEASSDAH